MVENKKTFSREWSERNRSLAGTCPQGEELLGAGREGRGEAEAE